MKTSYRADIAHKFIQSFGKDNFECRLKTTILLVGCGALGSKIAVALAKHGYNQVLVDPDFVAPHNLPLQEYSSHDLDRPKVEALAEHIAQLSPFPVRVKSLHMRFNEAVIGNKLPSCDIVVAVPDNDLARLEVAHHFYCLKPVVFAGASESGDYGYVFVQEPHQACLLCAFPTMDARLGTRGACGGFTGEIAYILTGFVLFAVDSLVMEHPLRTRSWNLAKLYLNSMPDLRVLVRKRAGCPLCSHL